MLLSGIVAVWRIPIMLPVFSPHLLRFALLPCCQSMHCLIDSRALCRSELRSRLVRVKGSKRQCFSTFDWKWQTHREPEDPREALPRKKLPIYYKILIVKCQIHTLTFILSLMVIKISMQLQDSLASLFPIGLLRTVHRIQDGNPIVAIMYLTGYLLLEGEQESWWIRLTSILWITFLCFFLAFYLMVEQSNKYALDFFDCQYNLS